MTDGSRIKRTAFIAAAGIFMCLLLLAAAGIAWLLFRHPVRHIQIIRNNCELYDLDPAVVCAVINAESRFIDTAASGAGASGLMQLMEDTANWIAPMAGLHDFTYNQVFDPEINIRLGCFYLRMCLDRFGNLRTALCAYNAGSSRVDEWLADPRYSSDGITLDAIPYAETRAYVERIDKYIEVYRFMLCFMGIS